MPAWGYVLVRDEAEDGRARYLQRDRTWSPEIDRVQVFATTRSARQWIRSRPPAYWLLDPGGRARIISARAAGVT